MSPYGNLTQAVESFLNNQTDKHKEEMREALLECRRQERKFGVEAVLEDDEDFFEET